MYFYNKPEPEPNQPLAKWVMRIKARNTVIDMVNSGEMNLAYMIEVVRSHYEMPYKEALTLVLEGIARAQKN